MAEMTKILSVQLDASKAIEGIVQLNNAIDENNALVKTNSNEIKQNNKLIEEGAGDVDQLKARNLQLAKANEELAAKTKVLKDERRALQKETQQEIKMQSEAEGSVARLRAELSKLTKQYDALEESERTTGAEGRRLQSEINDITNRIKDAEEGTHRYWRSVGNYAIAGQSMKAAMREMQEQIMQLTLEFRSLDEETRRGATGQALQQQIEALTNQASVYRDTMDDVRRSVRAGASDTMALNAALQAGQTVVATFGLAKNAATALGIANESLAQSMLKMQQAMQAVQALTVIQNALQKESNVMKGIAIIQSKAAAAAARIEAAATASATGATVAQTAALKALNIVAKANPYVLLATSIAAVIGLIVTFTDSTKDATKATEDSTDSIDKESKALRYNAGVIDGNLMLKERLKKSEKEWSDAVSSNAQNQLAEYTKLQLKWLECNKDQKTREKFQKEYGDEVNRVAGRVLKLAEYEDLFVNKTNDVVNAILARAEAEAAAKKYADAIIKKAENDRNGTVANGRYYRVASEGNEVDISELYKREIALSDKQRRKLENLGLGSIRGGVSVELTAGQAELLTDAYKKEADAIEALDDAEIEYWKNISTNKMKEQAAAEKKAGLGSGNYSAPKAFSGGGKTSKGGGSGSAASKSAQQEAALTAAQLEDNLTKVLADAYEKRAKVEEKYTQEWIDTTKAAINKKYEQDIDTSVANYNKDLAELQKSLKNKKITQSQYNDFYVEYTKAHNDKMKALDLQRAADIKKVDDEVNKYNQEQQEKEKKANEDALKRAKERAEKEIQIMLESMPEGSKGELDWKLRQIDMQLQEELALYVGNEQMKLAITNKYNAERLDAIRRYAEAEIEIQQQKYDALGSIVGGLGEMFGAFGEQQKEFVILQKSLALAEILISQAVAIANAIKKATLDPENFTVWQLIGAIATSVTSVTVAMAQAFKSLDEAKFATGGYIRGAGTGTSDSIPIRVSNGESVMNANTTAMFGGLLSSLNQLGGGVPIQVAQTAQSVRGEDMLARAVARGVAMLPNPVVSVQDINNGQRQVEVMNERAML